MTHPLVPQILDLAAPVAEVLGLEVVGVVFHTNQNPPVLRVDVRNCECDTSLNDCERMSRALESALDTADVIPGTYVLEVSSPGISRQLSSDREFISFKGFSVLVKLTEPVGGQQEWIGQLIGRDDTAVHLSQKGKVIVLPREFVVSVQLNEKRH